ncbi:MAG: hypothetical protein IH958_02330 [Chloroflexi bacterium]|nr:hypothetical protein [Chloroflexota bacterium]
MGVSLYSIFVADAFYTMLPVQVCDRQLCILSRGSGPLRHNALGDRGTIV